MKKIVYNENTKEIDVIEKEDTKERSKVIRAWLEKNKIFFEVFSYVFVGIMGIVLSVVGWKTNERSMKINQKQLEIQDNDREPYFKFEENYVYKKLGDKKLTRKCTLKNIGGRISNSYLKIYTYLRIYISGGNENETYYFRCVFPDKYIFDKEDSNLCLYDEENKGFIFYETGTNKYKEIENKLNECIENKLNEYDVFIIYEDYLNIDYSNYKNEPFDVEYKMYYDDISKNQEYKNENIEDLGEVTIDNVKDIARKVKEEIEYQRIVND